MRYERKIGKKVWLLDGSLERGFQLKSKDTYTLKEVKLGKDCGDWANHFVIERDSDGQVMEVMEFQVIFSIVDNNIYEYLSYNDLYAEVGETPIGAISVDISWGDWKHEHLWCKDLMRYIGYKEIGSRVTEEDCSDTYSAIHYFLKTG